MTRRYRFALVGDGYMARRYMACLDGHPRAEVAVVTKDRKAGTLTALGRDPGIDGVVVCSPDATHPGYVAELLPFDKLILCEKPLARTKDEFRTLQRLTEGRTQALLVGMNCRFRSRIQRLKALINGGALGRVSLVNAMYYSNIVPIIEGRMKSWWLEFPDGIIPFLHGGAIHLLDALRFLVGDVQAVHCIGASRAVSAPVGGDSFVVVLRFAGGAVANVVISGTSLAPNRFQIAIDGERGSVDDQNEYVLDEDTQAPTARPLPIEDFKDLDREMAHVIAVLDGKAVPLNTIEEAYCNFRVIRACEESSRTGNWVPLHG